MPGEHGARLDIVLATDQLRSNFLTQALSEEERVILTTAKSLNAFVVNHAPCL